MLDIGKKYGKIEIGSFDIMLVAFGRKTVNGKIIRRKVYSNHENSRLSREEASD